MRPSQREVWDTAVERAIFNNVPKIKSIIKDYPYLEVLAESVREAKLRVLDNLDWYIDSTMKAVERSRGVAHLAKTVSEAQNIALDIIGERKRIVFAKTNVAYEVHLREFLQSHGKEVWETDLGEYLIQLSNEPPSHVVFPALHMTKEAVGQMLHDKLDASVTATSSYEEMVAAVRKFLMEKYMSAEVGVTGANSVAADTGSVALLENEGNIRIDTVLPGTHIAITGVDKIVPTVKDAMNELLVQSAYGGLFPPSYINITSGPSSTADIELKRVSPATGPGEFHLILVDNGRTRANADPVLRQALLCIKCGRCYFSCPVYRALGSSWGNPPYGGPMGAMWTAIVDDDTSVANLCAHSAGCREVCPVKIDIPAVLEYIKYLDSKRRSVRK
jgi:L-lactate dehydrogenase complex protein LldG